nr:MAG TPA: Endonuclease [Caudoviricetes sp.]
MRIGNVSVNVRNKYHNRKTKGFDSAKEWRRNQELEALQRAGEISELNRQVPFVLMPSYTIADETTRQGFRTIREIRYIADFTYRLKDGTRIIEDVKGMQTDVFKLKRKLLERKIALGAIEGEFRIY